MAKWLEEKGVEEDIVISTRVRLARNLDSFKFPQIMNTSESEELINIILNRVEDSKDNYKFIKVKDLNEREKLSFVENHLISPGLLKSPERGCFFVRDDEKVSIMLNEEDHIRFQTLLPGFNMEEGWKICSEIDDFIERDINYAFDEDFGYLTACPTNVGTGLRASVMVHLPAITMTGHLDSLGDSLRKLGLTIRGMYGEGTKGLGCLYQISNQTTLGQSEEEILLKLDKIMKQIISRERGTRRFLEKNRKLDLEDRIIRSYGLVKNNRRISTEEAMKNLSNIKLGIDMDIIENIDSKEITKLMIRIQRANIQVKADKKMDKKSRDIERSKMIIEHFKSWEE